MGHYPRAAIAESEFAVYMVTKVGMRALGLGSGACSVGGRWSARCYRKIKRVWDLATSAFLAECSGLHVLGF